MLGGAWVPTALDEQRDFVSLTKSGLFEESALILLARRQAQLAMHAHLVRF